MKLRATILALTILLAAAAGAAAREGPLSAPPAAQAFALGSLRLTALRDGQYVADNDGQTFGVGVGPAAVARVLGAAGAATDQITLAVDALLVEAPGRKVLIDTGLGPRVHGALLQSLARSGVAPGEITDVLITHSHGDHAGGLVTEAGAIAFPRASIRMSAREWAWMRGPAGEPDLARKIAPRVRTFQPGEVVAPGITAVDLAGHTPGHVGYEIVSGQARLLDIGDIAHSAIVSLAEPGWSNGFDIDPALAKAVRLRTMARLAASQELVFAPHFPFPGVGRIVRAGSGYAWRPGLR